MVSYYKWTWKETFIGIFWVESDGEESQQELGDGTEAKEGTKRSEGGGVRF